MKSRIIVIVTVTMLTLITPILSVFGEGTFFDLVIKSKGEYDYIVYPNGSNVYLTDTNNNTIASGDAEFVFNKLNEMSGKSVLIKNGVYLFNNSIAINNVNNLKIYGENYPELRLNSQIDNWAFFSIGSGCSNIYIEKIWVNANKKQTNEDAAGLNIKGSNVTVVDCKVSYAQHGQIAADGNYITIKNCEIFAPNYGDDGIILRGKYIWIINNTIHDMAYHNGVSLVSANDVYVKGNLIWNTNDGVALEQAGSDVLIINNYIHSRAHGIAVYYFSGSSEYNGYKNVVISNNTIIPNASYNGISIGGSLNENYSIIGNNIIGGTYGIVIQSGGKVVGMNISGNVFEGQTRGSICVWGELHYAKISNNVMTPLPQSRETFVNQYTYILALVSIETIALGIIALLKKKNKQN